MFIDENIPIGFEYIADISDNYIVLVNEPTLTSDRTYEAYYQFFYPSTQVLYVPDYTIYNGNRLILDHTEYSFNSSGNPYLTYATYIYSKDAQQLILTSGDRNNDSAFFDRPDINNIFIGIGFFLAIYILIWNLASSLVHRGGIFHA